MQEKDQHKLGQHYSENKALIEPYIEDIINAINHGKIIVDPFVGEGSLLFYAMNLVEDDKLKQMILDGRFCGYDITDYNIEYMTTRIYERFGIEVDEISEYFKVRDSLIDNTLPDNSYIITNPPYLAKNVVKKKFPEDFEIYFSKRFSTQNDYYEIAINQYSFVDGIWIVPSNLLSSNIMSTCRANIINNLNNVIVYQKQMFSTTDIPVISYQLNLGSDNSKLDIKFVSDEETKLISYNLNGTLMMEDYEKIKETKNKLKIHQGFIDTKIAKGKNVVSVIDTSYKHKTISISDEQFKLLTDNVLMLRTTDTGTKKGKLGIYLIDDLWGKENNNCIGLITKVSSRVYTQLFFSSLRIEEQIHLMIDFNTYINDMRIKYNSLFLTNYKNASNGDIRKRITYKEVFSILNQLYIDRNMNVLF